MNGAENIHQLISLNGVVIEMIVEDEVLFYCEKLDKILVYPGDCKDCWHNETCKFKKILGG
jgi:hypothetical protein